MLGKHSGVIYCGVLIACSLLFTFSVCGCKKDTPEETTQRGPIRNTLKITNTGAIDIRILRVNYNYDANSCTIEDLKSGQMVRREIILSYPTTLQFTIEYADGKSVKHPSEEWFMPPGELQIVVEDNGKMFFR